ncbi:hypothetical protein [Bacillus cereus]|uniref:hypothetical protein n=1 Tax=Bacillus cereus TaxID=1396 RepID=UPI000BFE9AF6|nr:hypothetical protein [Bacillus cereus]PGY78253.1 hypothetical protein COE42_01470 [Bacillus cereus]
MTNNTIQTDDVTALSGAITINGIVGVTAIFNEPYKKDNGERWAVAEGNVTIPSNTTKVIVLLNGYSMQFGDDKETFDRPFTHMGIQHTVTISGTSAHLQVKAGISDKNADDQWYGSIKLSLVCIG